jgi:hypothetical protein
MYISSKMEVHKCLIESCKLARAMLYLPNEIIRFFLKFIPRRSMLVQDLPSIFNHQILTGWQNSKA